MGTTEVVVHRAPWNKGKIVGQKAPFKLKEIWALRIRLQMEGRSRELDLRNLGIDSKLRGCDLLSLRVRDVCHGRPGCGADDRDAAEDEAACPVRDHGGHARVRGCVDQAGWLEVR